MPRSFCRHYSMEEFLAPKCALGLDPKAMGDRSSDWPCIDRATAYCAKRENYTAEELAAQEEEHQKRIAKAAKVFAIVNDRIRQPDCIDLPEGSVPCPACGTGSLRWARLPEYGTCWIVCTTDGCAHIHLNTGSKFEVKN